MNRSDKTRDLFMLKGPLAKNGYDWWWHNFTGYKRSTGEAKTFFIEYYICNPASGTDKPVFGQLPQNKERKIKPSYVLIKAGYWGAGAQQIHNFYGINDFHCTTGELDIRIADNLLTEKKMKGSCSLSKEESIQHPEYMSGWGSMSWDLQINKQIAFHVGYGASPLFRQELGF
jgi:tocopherol cyclase